MDSYVNGSDVESGIFTVTATHKQYHETTLDLTINGEVVHTTDEHPFLVMNGDEYRWVEAEHLNIDDQVVSVDSSLGVVEAVTIIDEPQTMYNLTVDLVATYVIGEGHWVVHNSNWPLLCDIPVGELGEGRYRVETLGEISKIPGIYEFVHLNRKELPYVGSSLDLVVRLRGRKYAGDFLNYSDVVFTPIAGASKTMIELAETIRILQVRAGVAGDIYNMANGWNDNLVQITRKLYPTKPANVPKFWKSNIYLPDIKRLMNNSEYAWPSWLKP